MGQLKYKTEEINALLEKIDNTTVPNVPDWAMNNSKPEYTADEVGALPENTEILSEAPQDGKSYARKNGDWVEVSETSSGGGETEFPEAPQDGKVYGRKNGGWEEVSSSDLQLSKELVEGVLIGNVITHSHDSVIERPVCDVLNIATLEEDIQNLVGDGSVPFLLGTGSESDPYLLDSALKFLLIYTSISGFNDTEKVFYKLTVNCDLSDFEIPVSHSTDVSKIARYDFDGNNHFVRNFVLLGTDTDVSMFHRLGISDGVLSNGMKYDSSVRNLGIKDATFLLTISVENSTFGLGGFATGVTLSNNPDAVCLNNCYIDGVTFKVVGNAVSDVSVAPLTGTICKGLTSGLYVKNSRLILDGNKKANVSVFLGPIDYNSNKNIAENCYVDLQISGTYTPHTVSGASSQNAIAFNNMHFCCNVPIGDMAQGCQVISKDELKSNAFAAILGNQYGWDANKNDGYPYLVNQSVVTSIYDGYVRKSEIDKLLEVPNAGKPSVDGLYKLPFELTQLTPESTSDEVRTAIGGLDGFQKAIHAIKDFSRIVITATMGSQFICCEAITKMVMVDIQEDGTEMEGFVVTMSNGSVTDGFTIAYLKGADTFVYQKA